jgi:hypothetical protein
MSNWKKEPRKKSRNKGSENRDDSRAILWAMRVTDVDVERPKIA